VRSKNMLLAAMVGLVLALAACSSQSGASGGQPASSEPALPPGTPNVAHPLDTANFQKSPCAVLKREQLQQLSVSANGEVSPNDPTGPACDWHDSGGPSKMAISIGFLTSGHGLADLYGQKDTFQYFQPISDIDGYPAVIAMSVDRHTQGACSVVVGVSNQLAVNTMVQLTTVGGPPPDYTNPCARNQKVAAAVVQTLKGGS
jgi:Protein of unknown function (DUF3558)